MAALSEDSTEVVREAIAAAHRHGTIVSYDANYRPSLWKSRGGRQRSVEVNRSILPFVDVFFGHEGDMAAVLGDAAQKPAWHTLDSFAPMAERVVADFPNIKVLATTIRRTHTASRNSWSAFAYAGHNAFAGLRFDELEILDRVGGGDSFASGLLYGLLSGKALGWALDCGIAHGALTMTTPGDASMVSLAEVERLMSGSLPGTDR
jgi:2-dehydro-3-deoxygluconokinase